MKYRAGARVYLVSRPAVDWEQIAAFLSDEDLPPIPDSIRAGTDDSNAIIEVSARLCYMSFGRGRRDIADFIHNLLSSKDGSVFEHVNYGFVFTGVSRSLTHELVRHRAGFAYSQRSQRYVDETEGAFVLPPALTGEDATTPTRLAAYLQRCYGVGVRKLRQIGRMSWSRCFPGVDSSTTPTAARLSDKQRARCFPTQPRPRYSSQATSGLGGTSSRCAPLRSPTGRYGRSPSGYLAFFSRKRPSCSATSRSLTFRTAPRSRRRNIPRSDPPGHFSLPSERPRRRVDGIRPRCYTRTTSTPCTPTQERPCPTPNLTR